MFYYARVSSRGQNLDRQLEAFKALGADEREIITDKESGKNLERPGYQALKRATIRQRQAEGISAAKAKGKHLGRPAAQRPNNWNEAYDRWKDGRLLLVRL